jgi:hypothetical protein
VPPCTRICERYRQSRSSARGAIRRAESLYAARLADSGSESEISGLGLLVLQRAMLAIEDLGGLLHAFTDPPSWKAFVSYNLDSISGTFDALFAGGDAAIARAYLFPTYDAIRDEPDLTEGTATSDRASSGRGPQRDSGEAGPHGRGVADAASAREEDHARAWLSRRPNARDAFPRPGPS